MSAFSHLFLRVHLHSRILPMTQVWKGTKTASLPRCKWWFSDFFSSLAITGKACGGGTSTRGTIHWMTGPWFQICFISTPYFGKIPILTSIFQKGLKPPTRWIHWANFMLRSPWHTQKHPEGLWPLQIHWSFLYPVVKKRLQIQFHSLQTSFSFKFLKMSCFLKNDTFLNKNINAGKPCFLWGNKLSLQILSLKTTPFRHRWWKKQTAGSRSRRNARLKKNVQPKSFDVA